MNVYQLVERLNGEIVANVAQVRMGSQYIVLAKHNGVEFEFTEEGRQLALQPDVMPASLDLEDTPAPKKRGRPAKSQVLQSAPSTVDEQFDSVFRDTQ